MSSAVSGLSMLRPGCVREQIFDFVGESGLSGFFSKINMKEKNSAYESPHIRIWSPNPDNPDNLASSHYINGLTCPGSLPQPGQPGLNQGVTRSEDKNQRPTALSYLGEI